MWRRHTFPLVENEVEDEEVERKLNQSRSVALCQRRSIASGRRMRGWRECLWLWRCSWSRGAISIVVSPWRKSSWSELCDDSCSFSSQCFAFSLNTCVQFFVINWRFITQNPVTLWSSWWSWLYLRKSWWNLIWNWSWQRWRRLYHGRSLSLRLLRLSCR